MYRNKYVPNFVMLGFLYLSSAAALGQPIHLLCTTLEANYEIVPGDNEVIIDLEAKTIRWNQHDSELDISANELSVKEPRFDLTISRLTLEYQLTDMPKRGARRTEPFISSGKCKKVDRQL